MYSIKRTNFISFGKVYWKMNDFVSSKKCFSTSLTFSDKVKDEISQYHTLNELTSIL